MLQASFVGKSQLFRRKLAIKAWKEMLHWLVYFYASEPLKEQRYLGGGGGENEPPTCYSRKLMAIFCIRLKSNVIFNKCKRNKYLWSNVSCISFILVVSYCLPNISRASIRIIQFSPYIYPFLHTKEIHREKVKGTVKCV